MLLLIPQRYEFSSKSQLLVRYIVEVVRCCWYHKGTNFQANHNGYSLDIVNSNVVADTTKVRIFKQITTEKRYVCVWFWLLLIPQRYEFSSKSQLRTGRIMLVSSCCWYHKGTNFQANHNPIIGKLFEAVVVADTTKVRIFKQITTKRNNVSNDDCCCWYHKGTNFQANHNGQGFSSNSFTLLLIPQRYEFSSKSQLNTGQIPLASRCCWYHKGTNFQANHNTSNGTSANVMLLLIPQRYEFSSKSQLAKRCCCLLLSCCWYHKGTNFQANHNYVNYWC